MKRKQYQATGKLSSSQAKEWGDIKEEEEETKTVKEKGKQNAKKKED